MRNFAAVILAVSFIAPAFAADPNEDAARQLARIAAVRDQQQADRDTPEQQQARNMEAYERDIVPKLQAKREAQEAAARREAIKMAFASTPSRKWVCLGNSAKGMAKITGYKNGEVTLTRTDGKEFTFTVSKLGKRDREIIEDFARTAGL